VVVGFRRQVGTNSVSFVGGQAATRYNHEVAIEELEQLDLQGVELGDLTLVPERWELRPSSGQQTLWFLTTVTPQAHEQFELCTLTQTSGRRPTSRSPYAAHQRVL
jgi:hypothetical protein